MGNGDSKEAGASSPAPRAEGGGGGGGKVVVNSRAAPTFLVEPRRRIRGLPTSLLLRVDTEAIAILHPETEAVLRSYPYHRVLCWGYTPTSFQFRVFRSKGEVAGERDGTALPAAAGTTATVAGAGSPTAASHATLATTSFSESHASRMGSVASSPHAVTPTAARSPLSSTILPLAVDAALNQDTPAYLEARGSGGGVGDPSPRRGFGMLRDGCDDVIHLPPPKPSELPPDADASSVETLVVLTAEGLEIESEVMGAVRRLMAAMGQVGISDDEFEGVIATLRSLADAGADDQALTSMKQMATTRALTVKQAVSLVQVVGEVSPFDQMDAACAVYDSMINKASFPLVLACFGEAVDRSNICHRLGIRVDDTGSIVALSSHKGRAGGGLSAAGAAT